MLLSLRFQDLLFLACSHPENRISLTKMEEWPEWILEVLISNYEALSFNFSLKFFPYVISILQRKFGIYHVAVVPLVLDLRRRSWFQSMEWFCNPLLLCKPKNMVDSTFLLV